MRRTTPLWLLNKVKRGLMNRLIPLKKTSLNGTVYYYTREAPPHDPKAFSALGQEFHHKIDHLSGDTAIDVGANIGSYTLRLARRFRTVVAFEPDLAMCNILRLNAKVNKLQNIMIEEMALGDEDGVLPLYVRRGTGATSLDPSHYGLKYETVKKVRVARLDSLSGIPGKVDFVKLDAEGLELPILKGASRIIARFRPVLGIEVHSPRTGSVSMCACDTCIYLYSCGYNTEVTGESSSATPVHWVWAVANR